MADSLRPPGLIQRYREELQVRHYARRTEAVSSVGAGFNLDGQEGAS